MATGWTAQSYASDGRRQVLKVLVVDDEQESSRELGALLSQWGCEVQIFDTGSDAVACVHDCQPHVALISLNLPDMRGCDVAHGLCHGRGTHNLLLISLSTEDQAAARGAANSLGFDFHLIKPVDASEFHRALVQIMHDEELPVRPLS